MSQMKQKTLFDYSTKAKKEKKTKKISKSITELLQNVPPKDFDFPPPLKYETFFEIVEIVELCFYLNEKFDLDVKIDKLTFFNNFLTNLNNNSFSNDYDDLYTVVYVFLMSIINMEIQYKDSKEKYRLIYSEEMIMFKKYLNYVTFCEFVRIFLFKHTFNYGSKDCDRFRQLLNNQEFISFSFTNKLWILRRILDDIITHPQFSLTVVKSIEPSLDSKTQKNTENHSNGTTNKEDPIIIPVKTLRSNSNQIYINDRTIPEKIKQDIYIWKFNCLEKIIIEDIELKKVMFYDKNHTEQLLEFNNDFDNPIIISCIKFLSNEIFSDSSSKKHIDIKEHFKRMLCQLVEKSFKRGKKFEYFEKRLIMANKISPYTLAPWAQIFVEIVSIFWPHIKSWETKFITISPYNSRKNFFTYVQKLTTWSGACLAIEFIKDNFVELRDYKYLMSSYMFRDKQEEEDEESEEEPIKCIKCGEVQSTTFTNEYEFICRGCRLKQRNQLKNPVKKPKLKTNSSMIETKSNKNNNYKPVSGKNTDRFHLKNSLTNSSTILLRDDGKLRTRKYARHVISSDED